MSGCGPARTAGVKSGWVGDPLLVCVVGGRKNGRLPRKREAGSSLRSRMTRLMAERARQEQQ